MLNDNHARRSRAAQISLGTTAARLPARLCFISRWCITCRVLPSTLDQSKVLRCGCVNEPCNIEVPAAAETVGGTEEWFCAWFSSHRRVHTCFEVHLALLNCRNERSC